MRVDIGSWDRDCITVTQEIREGLVALVKGRTDFQCTPMQGSGTFAVEAVLGSAVPPSGKLLVLSNGAYGQRMKLMSDAYASLMCSWKIPRISLIVRPCFDKRYRDYTCGVRTL